MPSEMMTAAEVAEYLKLDVRTVYRKFRRCELPGVKIGRALRFRRDAIDAWVRRQELYRWGEAFAKERGITEQDVLDAIEEMRYGRVASRH